MPDTAQDTVQKTLIFRGHLIDSLTLAKIMDRVQALGCDYRLNDLEIGAHKKDISSVTLSLLADSPAQLTAVLNELAPYGPVAPDSETAQLERCQADGVPPAGAYLLTPPRRVFIQAKPLAVDAPACALVIDEANGASRLVAVHALKTGDTVVIGTAGLAW